MYYIVYIKYYIIRKSCQAKHAATKRPTFLAPGYRALPIACGRCSTRQSVEVTASYLLNGASAAVFLRI